MKDAPRGRSDKDPLRTPMMQAKLNQQNDLQSVDGRQLLTARDPHILAGRGIGQQIRALSRR